MLKKQKQKQINSSRTDYQRLSFQNINKSLKPIINNKQDVLTQQKYQLSDLLDNIQMKNKSPNKMLFQVPSQNKRISIDTTLMNGFQMSKTVSLKVLSPKQVSFSMNKLNTQPSPTKTFSLVDFWKLQNTPSKNNLTFNKLNHQEEVLNHYLSRVLINKQTNILQAFKKLRSPSDVVLKAKKINKLNKWYKVAANIVAMNSKINQQKSLWRLKGIRQIPQKTSYLKYIDMVVYPQEYINYQPHFKALKTLQMLISDNNLRKIVHKFQQHSQQIKCKKKFLNMVLKNREKKYQRAVKTIQALPNSHKINKYHKIKQLLKFYLIKQINKFLKLIFDMFKQDWEQGKINKYGTMSQMAKNTYRNADKVFNKWFLFMKEKVQQLKRQKIMKLFEIVQNKQYQDFSTIFEGFDPNLRRKIKQSLTKVMEIQESHRKQNLAKTFKRWRRQQNIWFSRAAKILALNSVLNNQTSLWRLKNKTIQKIVS